MRTEDRGRRLVRPCRSDGCSWLTDSDRGYCRRCEAQTGPHAEIDLYHLLNVLRDDQNPYLRMPDS